jgi:chemotaxis signal transduction protein
VLRSRHRAPSIARAQQPATGKSCGLLLFSVGGRQIAACMEEIAGVRPWPKMVPVPSDTPFVSALVRLENECLPVYDLAGRLNRTLDPASGLCLIVKHEEGPLAVCIDSSVPSLHMADASDIREGTGEEADVTGTCSIGGDPVSLIRLARLGRKRRIHA